MGDVKHHQLPVLSIFDFHFQALCLQLEVGKNGEKPKHWAKGAPGDGFS
jgi:hypothetical protein